MHEGLAEGLSSGGHTLMDLFNIYEISISLTKKGLENYQMVLNIIFQYLKMLKEKCPQKYIFEEIQKVNNLKFDNKDKEKPDGYVTSLSARMHKYPMEDILRVNYLMEDYKPEVIKKCLNDLTTENMRIYLISQELEKECN